MKENKTSQECVKSENKGVLRRKKTIYYERENALNQMHGQMMRRMKLKESKAVKKVKMLILFVWCLTTHQPLWVISVRRYQIKHDLD